MNTERMISTLIGIGIGMVVGTLIAPDKGSRTRQELSQKSKDYLNDLNKEMKQWQKNIDEKIDKKKEQAQEGIQELSEKEEEITGE